MILKWIPRWMSGRGVTPPIRFPRHLKTLHAVYSPESHHHSLHAEPYRSVLTSVGKVKDSIFSSVWLDTSQTQICCQLHVFLFLLPDMTLKMLVIRSGCVTIMEAVEYLETASVLIESAVLIKWCRIVKVRLQLDLYIFWTCCYFQHYVLLRKWLLTKYLFLKCV